MAHKKKNSRFIQIRLFSLYSDRFSRNSTEIRHKRPNSICILYVIRRHTVNASAYTTRSSAKHLVDLAATKQSLGKEKSNRFKKND